MIEHAVTLASVDEAAALFANDASPTTTSAVVLPAKGRCSPTMMLGVLGGT